MQKKQTKSRNIPYLTVQIVHLYLLYRDCKKGEIIKKIKFIYISSKKCLSNYYYYQRRI